MLKEYFKENFRDLLTVQIIMIKYNLFKIKKYILFLAEKNYNGIS